MELQSYAEYKSTDNEWFPLLPVDWDVRKIKFSFVSRSGAIKTGPFGSQLKSEDMNAGEIKVYNQRSVIRKDLDIGEEYIKLEKFDELKAFEVFAGDLLISTRGTIGKCFQVKPGSEKGILHPCLMRIQFEQNETLNEYFVYLLEGSGLLLEQLNISSNSTTLEVIYSDTLKNLYAPLPSINEQQKIAAFLDYKTQQIDQLIEKKKALIEKLEEKRIAVITQAVTKGLDKNVTLKPSGVDWLGDVPEHWKLRRLKFLSNDSLQYGANEAAEMDDRDQPRFIRITDVKPDGTLNQDTFRSIPEDIAKPFILSDGDILLARSGATVGKSFIYSKEWGIAAYAGYLIRFRVDLDVMNADFVYQFFQTSTFWANINSTLIQSTIQNFSAEKYANVLMPLPPKQEQEEILNFLNGVLNKINGMTCKTNHAISKLEEYRSAIITSAVTGKIDVRDVEIPKEIT